MKKTQHYFAHDANMGKRQESVMIRMKYGLEGYGAYMIIMEILREAEGYQIKKSSIESIQWAERIDNLQEWCDRFVEAGALQTDGQRYWSAYMLEKMAIMEKKAEVSRKNGARGGRPRKAVESMVAAIVGGAETEVEEEPGRLAKKPSGFPVGTQKNQTKIKEKKRKEREKKGDALSLLEIKAKELNRKWVSIGLPDSLREFREIISKEKWGDLSASLNYLVLDSLCQNKVDG